MTEIRVTLHSPNIGDWKRDRGRVRGSSETVSIVSKLETVETRLRCESNNARKVTVVVFRTLDRANRRLATTVALQNTLSISSKSNKEMIEIRVKNNARGSWLPKPLSIVTKSETGAVFVSTPLKRVPGHVCFSRPTRAREKTPSWGYKCSRTPSP